MGIIGQAITKKASGEYPEWKPGQQGRDGDTIAGVISNIEIADLGYGDTAILFIDVTQAPTQNGQPLQYIVDGVPTGYSTVKWVAGQTDAANQLVDLDPDIGDYITVHRVGSRAVKNGMMVQFSIVVTPAGAVQAPQAQPAPAAAPQPAAPIPAAAPVAAPVQEPVQPAPVAPQAEPVAAVAAPVGVDPSTLLPPQ